ncbi:MAG TPA: MaoC family dehydratase [Amycolatopsis sp.]|nr:MaoC family dehydratase [Amycolatopsis sp.]
MSVPYRTGTELPMMTVEATPTFVVSAALATRDFQDVHHDRDAAVARGSKDIFLNILTDNGLVQRYVSDWAGPEALVRSIKIRLGVPCYAYDTLTFTGRVISCDGRDVVLSVSAVDSLGEHLTGTVELTMPGAAS